MNKFLRFIDSLSIWTGKLVSVFVGLTILIITYEVVARYVFNAPTVWANEAATFLCGIFAVMGGAYTLCLNGHVNVDVIHMKLSPKTRTIVDLLTFPLFLIYFGTLVWLGYDLFWDSVTTLERSGTSWSPPIYPLKLFIPLSALILLLQGFVKFIQNFRIALGKGNSNGID